MFRPYLRRWNLTPDGAARPTPSSDLLPVRWRGRPAILKLARSEEERVGHTVMVWLAGEGAAQVYAHDGVALLMERLEDDRSLAELAVSGPEQDDEATRLLSVAVAALHRPRGGAPPEVPDLHRWFRSLWALEGTGGLYALAAQTARALLDDPRDVRLLHGDIHHGNVLHSRARGWLAIDPKGLRGERGYDYANVLCNPDTAWAARPGRLARQSHLIARQAGLSRERLLRWTLAYAGLSAAWWREDGNGQEAGEVLTLAGIAAAELGLPTA